MSLPGVKGSFAPQTFFPTQKRQFVPLRQFPSFPLSRRSWHRHGSAESRTHIRSPARHVIEDTSPAVTTSYDPGTQPLHEYQLLFTRNGVKAGQGTAASIAATARVLFRTAIQSLDLPHGHDHGPLAEDYVDLIDTGLPDATAAFNKPNYEVFKLDIKGKVRRVCVRRRDLLREHRLQPRDLRRIDPSVDFAKPSPSITIKENVILLNLGGIRGIVAAEKVLLFEPNSNSTRKLLEILVPRLQQSHNVRGYGRPSESFEDFVAGYYQSNKNEIAHERGLPFELEVVEAALTIATGKLEIELLSVTKRVSQLLTKLPQQINPLNLDELRRTKQALVELENKADALRKTLEELMDDEDELVELNLSSRPLREERRRQRERERLERELERARETKEDGDDVRASKDDKPGGGLSKSDKPIRAKASGDPGKPKNQLNGFSHHASRVNGFGGDDLHIVSPLGLVSSLGEKPTPPSTLDQLMKSSQASRLGDVDVANRALLPLDSNDDDDLGNPSVQDAQDALEEMVEQEEEEREVEEVEDLLEYYLQRATDTQGEAERLLQSARDLEESIGVSLSARRYEVNRLELTLSIGSFAAAIGAMVAGIFGMNMRSMLELSVWSFWGVTGGIVIGCLYIFFAITKYTKLKKIL